MNHGRTTLAVAGLVTLFSGFALYLVVPRSADPVPALLAVWAVVGPLLTAIVQAYFHSQANQQGATISTIGAAAGASAALGQSTAVLNPTGRTPIHIGPAVKPPPTSGGSN